MFYRKAVTIIKNEGIGAFLSKGLMKAFRIFFQTNEAVWFKKDLGESGSGIDPDLPIKLVFTERDRIFNWLESQKNRFPWTCSGQEIKTAKCENHIYPYIVHDGNIIGYIKVGVNRVYIQDFDETMDLLAGDAFIYDTFVLPEYRGRHIGGFLVHNVSEYLQRLGFKRVWCHIPRWNSASLKAYQKSGFKKISSVRYTRLIGWKIFNRNPEEMMKEEPPVAQMTRRTFFSKTFAMFFLLAIPKILFKNNLFAAVTTERDEIKGEMPRKNEKSDVISVHSPKATYWDFQTYPYVDFIREEVVVNMLHEGVKLLTGAKSSLDAWQEIFSSYKPGDIVVIKPNFNDLYDDFHGFVASPALINAILDGLIQVLKIPPKDIIVYDCTRIIPDEFRKRIKYPIRYVEPFGSSFLRKVEYHTIGNPLPKADYNYEIKMSLDIRDKKGNPVKCYLPKVVTSAQHIINVPIMKSHQFVSNSGALKNHYGTVRFSDGHTGPEYIHPPRINESIVDVNSHEQIRNKTRLIVMDGLFGRLKKKGGPPDRWSSFPEASPNRLFISRDPVALDSISYHFIKKELVRRKENILSDEYLHIAQRRGLGQHEDIDSLTDLKQISFREIEV